ncbi:hypothetical protein HY501_03620 [Candidatus Woesearchaeota archaeon]|nr:hypothetical protein [Candidatus Woesearchaeota archaeon]
MNLRNMIAGVSLAAALFGGCNSAPRLHYAPNINGIAVPDLSWEKSTVEVKYTPSLRGRIEVRKLDRNKDLKIDVVELTYYDSTRKEGKVLLVDADCNGTVDLVYRDSFLFLDKDKSIPYLGSDGHYDSVGTSVSDFISVTSSLPSKKGTSIDSFIRYFLFEESPSREEMISSGDLRKYLIENGLWTF